MLHDHVIIAGFGLPGRAIAEVLHEQNISYCVIERNPTTGTQCARGGVPIITGDARGEDCLREAGIEHASMLAIAIPNDEVMLETVQTARRLNPMVRIIARCIYTSAGLKAMTLGANEIIVAEQVVAREFARTMQERFVKTESLSD
jgi:CPA2 family monovalent cation:H+ antiporter-2